MHSVSEVHHLTCHQELNGVSALEPSLLCSGLICTQNALPCHPKNSELFTPGELTRSLLSCFPQASFLACGLGLQQAGPKISRQISLLIVCIQHKPAKHGLSQSFPTAFRFQVTVTHQSTSLGCTAALSKIPVLTAISCGEQLGGKKRQQMLTVPLIASFLHIEIYSVFHSNHIQNTSSQEKKSKHGLMNALSVLLLSGEQYQQKMFQVCAESKTTLLRYPLLLQVWVRLGHAVQSCPKWRFGAHCSTLSNASLVYKTHAV